MKHFAVGKLISPYGAIYLDALHEVVTVFHCHKYVFFLCSDFSKKIRLKSEISM